MEKSKPYITSCEELNYYLTSPELSSLEKERRSIDDGMQGYTLSLSYLQSKQWTSAINMEHEWGHQLSERLCEKLVSLCEKNFVKCLYAIPTMYRNKKEGLEKVETCYKTDFSPPLCCSFLPILEALYKIDDYEYALFMLTPAFLILPEDQSFVVLVSWEKNCQIIAGPKETVEHLIDGDCKSSWQKLAEPWFYEDPDRHYDDLRQFAKELGYFDGDVSRPPSDAESS